MSEKKELLCLLEGAFVVGANIKAFIHMFIKVALNWLTFGSLGSCRRSVDVAAKIMYSYFYAFIFFF